MAEIPERWLVRIELKQCSPILAEALVELGTVEARIRELEQAVQEMTTDRNLWKEAHDDDCPNKNLLETTEAQLAAVTQERDDPPAAANPYQMVN